MAVLTVQQAARAANPIALVGADPLGDSFVNTGREALLIENADVSSKTVTMITQQTVDGLAVADLQITVPAGETHLIGPFVKSIYNDANDQVQITYSDTTSVTIAVVRIT